MRYLLLLALLVCLSFGCKATLEPGGAYSTGTNSVNKVVDVGFFATDAAFDIAFSTVDAAFKFEQANRDLLWKVSPNIKHELDKLRPKAKQAVIDYTTARAVYMNNPTPGNLSLLNSLLVVMQNLSSVALAVLPKK